MELRGRSNNYYVDNIELLQHMKDYKEKKEKDPNARIDDYTARCILKIVRKFASRKNFSGYTYKDDMISGAVENILLYIDYIKRFYIYLSKIHVMIVIYLIITFLFNFIQHIIIFIINLLH